MTKCPTCGIDKEAIQKDVDKLDKYVKMLMSVIEKDAHDKTWSGTLGQMVRKMEESK